MDVKEELVECQGHCPRSFENNTCPEQRQFVSAGSSRDTFTSATGLDNFHWTPMVNESFFHQFNLKNQVSGNTIPKAVPNSMNWKFDYGSLTGHSVCSPETLFYQPSECIPNLDSMNQFPWQHGNDTWTLKSPEDSTIMSINSTESVPINTIDDFPKSRSKKTKSAKSAASVKKHVPNACVHCKKAHLACDNQRPCTRCTTMGKKGCVDVKHKKRGRPRSTEYKKKQKFLERNNLPLLFMELDDEVIDHIPLAAE